MREIFGKKLKWCTYKITHIPVANYPKYSQIKA